MAQPSSLHAGSHQGNWDRVALIAKTELLAFYAGKDMDPIQVRLAHGIVRVSNEILATLGNRQLNDVEKRSKLYALGGQQRKLSQPFIAGMYQTARHAHLAAMAMLAPPTFSQHFSQQMEPAAAPHFWKTRI